MQHRVNNMPKKRMFLPKNGVFRRILRNLIFLT